MRLSIRSASTLLSLLLFAGMISRPATAGVPITSRSLGMAGAYTAVATGVDAVWTNPANLAFPRSGNFELHLVGAGALVYNSSISVSFYNRYNGDFIDSSEKEDILSRFPDDGWRLGAAVNAPLIGLRVKNFGFAVSAVVGFDQSLPKELIRRPLYGIDMKETYPLGPFEGTAIGFARYTAAYGLPLRVKYFDFFSVGASLSYLQGLATAEILEADGYFRNDYQAELEWQVRTRTGLKGGGFSFDLGVAAVKQNLRFGLALTPLAGKISWKDKTEEQRFWISGDSLNIVRLSEVDFDEAVEKSDTVVTISPFSTSLPTELVMGVSLDWKSYRFAADYHQGFRKRYGVSTQPELAFGLEARHLPFLPLRCGFAIGGGKGFRPAVGFGLHVLGLQWDFAFSGVGSVVPSHMRGFAFATNLRVVR